MNKLKTAKLHLVRFLFILPLLAVILLSFRKQIGDSFKAGSQSERAIHDTIPGKSWNPVPTESEKDFIRRHSLVKDITWGYIISVEKNDVGLPGKAGDAIMTIHFKNGKWDMYNLGLPSDVKKFKKNYGEEPPIPPPYTWVQEQNSKGNYIDIVDNNGNCTVVVKNEDGKEIDRLLLNKWKENQEYYDNLYGEILPPPPAEPPSPPFHPTPPVEFKLPDYVKHISRNAELIEIWLQDGKKESFNLKVPAEKAAFEKKYGELPPTIEEIPVEEINPGLSEFLERNPGVKHVSFEFTTAREKFVVQMHVIKKDGTTETYHLDDPADKAKAEKKYGELPLPVSEPFEPPTPASIYELSATRELNRANIGEHFEINENNARVRLKNGKVEEYNLANDTEKKKFETKYGKIIEVGARVEGVDEPVKVISTIDGHAAIAPTRIAEEGGVIFLNDEGNPISGEEEILVTITNKTTQQQLEGFIKQLKEKGIQLQFDNTKYDNGILVHVDGTMKIKGSNNSFSATDFNKLILSRVKDGEHIYLKVNVVEKKTS